MLKEMARQDPNTDLPIFARNMADMGGWLDRMADTPIGKAILAWLKRKLDLENGWRGSSYLFSPMETVEEPRVKDPYSSRGESCGSHWRGLMERCGQDTDCQEGVKERFSEIFIEGSEREIYRGC